MVATTQATYSRVQSVTINATVTAEGLPVSGATVSFTVTRSDRTTATGSALTSANGIATYKLRLKKQDPVGTYAVQAIANLNGATGSGTTTFIVQ